MKKWIFKIEISTKSVQFFSQIYTYIHFIINNSRAHCSQAKVHLWTSLTTGFWIFLNFDQRASIKSNLRKDIVLKMSLIKLSMGILIYWWKFIEKIGRGKGKTIRLENSDDFVYLLMFLDLRTMMRRIEGHWLKRWRQQPVGWWLIVEPEPVEKPSSQMFFKCVLSFRTHMAGCIYCRWLQICFRIKIDTFSKAKRLNYRRLSMYRTSYYNYHM